MQKQPLKKMFYNFFSAHSCVIYVDTPECDLSLLNSMYDEARKDFPALKPEDVQVTNLGAIRPGANRATLSMVFFNAIRFQVKEQPPPSYRKVESSDFGINY